jgi:deazaflavin-dependent oxidoreductase (nitroreductase family)
VHHDRASDVYVVASALGEQADWILNIQENPYVAVTVGLRRFVATTRRLGVIESAAVLLAYGRAHPLAFRMGTRFVTGRELRPTISSCHGLAQVVPLVALSSRTTVPTTIGMTGRARRRLGANLSCASSGSRGR